MTHTAPADPVRPPAALWRRLAAIVYDALVLAAVILFATALVSPFVDTETSTPANPLLGIYLCGVAFVFIGWFWTHGGQTLGMRAWRLQLVTTDGDAVRWRHALLRLVSGVPAWLLLIIGVISWATPARPPAGSLVAWLFEVPGGWLTLIASLWVIWDNSRFSWRDRASRTRVTYLPRQASGSGLDSTPQ